MYYDTKISTMHFKKALCFTLHGLHWLYCNRKNATVLIESLNFFGENFFIIGFFECESFSMETKLKASSAACWGITKIKLNVNQREFHKIYCWISFIKLFLSLDLRQQILVKSHRQQLHNKSDCAVIFVLRHYSTSTLYFKYTLYISMRLSKIFRVYMLSA